MARKEDIAKIAVGLMKNQKNIRNLGIVAHIDHGKTTLSDNLIAASGLISEHLAGKQCFMDSYELEQERGITINASNISLVYNAPNNEQYLVNLIDTPGHVDFGGDVIRAMRAVDGVIIVVDVVEGVMPQTETVIRQALKEYVKPILFLNKVDRLVNELKVTPDEMQKRFVEVINSVNKIINDYTPEEFKGKWSVSVQDNSVAFGSGYNNWALSFESIKQRGVTFKDVYDLCKAQDQKTLAQKSPLASAVLDMVVKNLPSPVEAQKYRIDKIWGKEDNEYGRAMRACDPNGPFSMMITDVIHDIHAGDVATGRIYSGSISKGKDVFLVGSKKSVKIQQVALYMGPDRVLVDDVVAGNIVALIGLKETYTGETIAEKEIKEFESFMSKAEPVITMSIEPKNPKDLPKLIDVLKQIVKEDPNVRTDLNQTTGEILVSGMGELHLEIVTYRIDHDNGLPIKVSPPIVVYEEAIQKESIEIEAKTPNKHNKFKIKVEPVPADLYDKIIDSQITGKIRENKDDEKIQKLIEMGFDRDVAKRIWALNNGCVLINRTRGIIQLNEVKELLIQSFMETTNRGPLAGEKVVGVFVYIEDATLHEDAIHRGPAQVLPAFNRGLSAAIMSSNPVIYEPKQKLYVSFPNDYLGAITKELQNRRARVEDIKTQGEETIWVGLAPVKELIGFSQAARSVTQGKAIWTAEYAGYEFLPHELQKKVVAEIRTRKGMEPEPKPAEYYMD